MNSCPKCDALTAVVVSQCMDSLAGKIAQAASSGTLPILFTEYHWLFSEPIDMLGPPCTMDGPDNIIDTKYMCRLTAENAQLKDKTQGIADRDNLLTDQCDEIERLTKDVAHLQNMLAIDGEHYNRQAKEIVFYKTVAMQQCEAATQLRCDIDSLVLRIQVLVEQAADIPPK